MSTTKNYNFMYRASMRLLEAHTCFNQLITGDLASKKDFIEKFLISNILGGSSFGIAGRRTRKNKKSNGNKNSKRKNRVLTFPNTKKNIKPRKKNKRIVSKRKQKK